MHHLALRYRAEGGDSYLFINGQSCLEDTSHNKGVAG